MNEPQADEAGMIQFLTNKLKKICRFIASIFDKLAGDQKITVQASEAAIRAA